MIDQLQRQLEIRDDAATLYLAGALRLGDLPGLRALCAALPSTVATLRVDVHALVAPAPDSITALRTMLHEWRLPRGAAIRLTLCSANLVATYREGGQESRPSGFGIPTSALASPARLASFL